MLSKVFLALACAAGPGVAQEAPQRDRAIPAQPPAIETPISLKNLVTNIARDQKPIWTFPAKAATGKHWKPALGVAMGTAALVVLDPHIEPYFHDKPGFASYKTGPLRGRNSTLAITLTPAVFYLTGLATHSVHAQNTGLLAAEALADTQMVSFVLKHAIGRLKPSDIPAHGNLRDTWFKYQGSLVNGGSFPSGHSASAFGVATVIAERYREHKWVPVVAYLAAVGLSLSRLPDLAHFPSDIFFGAAFGYGISHFVVLRR